MNRTPTRKGTASFFSGIRTHRLTPEELEQIADLCRRYAVQAVRISSAQQLVFLNPPDALLPALRRELHLSDPPALRRHRISLVQACGGRDNCRYGVGDSQTLGAAIERLSFAEPLPAKVKVGISGCRMCCCESWIRDVGLIAEQKGWKLLFGGNGAGRPRIGDVVAQGLSDREALALVEKCLTFYREHAKNKTRTARFMERVGIDALKQQVLG
ncbi:MAG: nitrite reductase [Desulfobulbus sp.]|nr:MAG: nitrite reductase [Desulfobulbus sp.]